MGVVTIFKTPKSKFYWYDFMGPDRRYRGSTEETNVRAMASASAPSFALRARDFSPPTDTALRAADVIGHGQSDSEVSGTIKRECAEQPVSYRRAGERLRRMPLRRRGFESSLQRQVLRGRFWQTGLIYLRPTLGCEHSWIQTVRP